MPKRITKSQVAPVTKKLLTAQNYTCPLCLGSLKASAKKDPCLDHDHKTGFLRDVLCRNCNGIEGKVYNLATRAKNKGTATEWLVRLSEYYERHKTPQYGGVLHYTHKTEEEKRLERNKKARERRAKAKRQAG